MSELYESRADIGLISSDSYWSRNTLLGETSYKRGVYLSEYLIKQSFSWPSAQATVVASTVLSTEASNSRNSSLLAMKCELKAL